MKNASEHMQSTFPHHLVTIDSVPVCGIRGQGFQGQVCVWLPLYSYTTYIRNNSYLRNEEWRDYCFSALRLYSQCEKPDTSF